MSTTAMTMMAMTSSAPTTVRISVLRSIRGVSVFFLLFIVSSRGDNAGSGQNAQPPPVKTGIRSPEAVIPVTARSAEPIIKSSCTMESFTPMARSSARV